MIAEDAADADGARAAGAPRDDGERDDHARPWSRFDDPFVLAPGVSVDPVAALPLDLRERLGGDPSDYVVTRPRTRRPSTVVDRTLAGLLERFRSPTRIVDAVLIYTAADGGDPRAVLEAAFGPLSALVADRLLVPAGSDADRPVDPTFAPGADLAGLRIVEVVHVLDDTEVYRATGPDGTDVAVKIAGPAATAQILAALANEEAILRRLDGDVAPRLVRSGDVDDRPYLATVWLHGSDLYEAAAQVRALGGREARAELLALGERVIAAYARLHTHGLLHGDVHPRNIMVDATGHVTLLDLGLAVPVHSTRPALVGGIDMFQAPEIASAGAGSGSPVRPRPSVPAEIYALGVMLYQVLTGHPTHAFSLHRPEMIRQLTEDPPLPFARNGVTGMPAVEQVVLRALAKRPEDRWPSASELVRAFRAAGRADGDGGPTATRPGNDPDGAVRRWVDAGASAVDPPPPRTLPPPRASVVHGAAGLAYAVLRTARRSGRPTDLAGADLWATRAAGARRTDDGFWATDLGVEADTLGRTSLFHARAGVDVVQALVAHALGDTARQLTAVDAFLESTREPEHWDLLFGRAGLLLGATLLLDTCPPGDPAVRLRAQGDRLVGELWEMIDRQPPVAAGTELRLLGLGHGWAGLLYATLTWCEAADMPVPDGLPDRLEQLAALGRPDGRVLRWPRRNDDDVGSDLAASWCNGAAGHVHLWAAAHRRYGDDRSLDRALRSGWAVLEDPPRPTATLCCGAAGRAYALARLAREVDDERWLGRAAALLRRAPAPAADARPGGEPSPGPRYRAHSLLHGTVGTDLARADIAAGGVDGMPFVEREGWPAGGW
ncbi:hypothetical protein GCM10011512_28140 [Tersicoccus solisilvae]|uniref:non-specific serine/threonine protein kinase n=1 Tax=Tersicoccus solisilvae TaxID=1882339 RepID=A0ABQ1PMB7_9MICC|nr:hypothetical protein GCM10011512_28140 [Tersicoccus solisilvae]